MDVSEPRLRHRGFFLHSPDGEPDTGEHENPEGVAVRVRFPGDSVARRMSSVESGTRFSGGRQLRTDSDVSEDQPAIRSGSVTGSRQRAHMPR
jgi:hypothetical protein